MIVMGAVDCALIAHKLLASFTIVDEWALVMNAVSKYGERNAGGGAVGMMEETSDWASSFLDFYAFFVFGYFYFFLASLEVAFDGDFYLLLLFDFSDLLSADFFLLLDSLPIQTGFSKFILFS